MLLGSFDCDFVRQTGERPLHDFHMSTYAAVTKLTVLRQRVEGYLNGINNDLCEIRAKIGEEEEEKRKVESLQRECEATIKAEESTVKNKEEAVEDATNAEQRAQHRLEEAERFLEISRAVAVGECCPIIVLGLLFGYVQTVQVESCNIKELLANRLH